MREITSPKRYAHRERDNTSEKMVGIRIERENASEKMVGIEKEREKTHLRRYTRREREKTRGGIFFFI